MKFTKSAKTKATNKTAKNPAAKKTAAPKKTAKGRMCMVRTYSAGVFAGEVVSRNGKEATLKNARRMWMWEGAASLSQLATDGTSKPNQCKFPCKVDEVTLTEVIEIIPMTQKAIKSIEAVPVWQK